MCGVAGISLKPRERQCDARSLVADLLRRQQHRGPDGCGVAGDRLVALGMNRLRIRSAPEDPVPFTDVGIGAVYAFNGEIYRDREWVPPGGLEEARSVCGPGPLDGMFALVSNPHKGVLSLRRDPLGIKPLYMREAGTGVAVASELTPLLQVFGPASVRIEAFAQFLLTGRRVVDGGSFFERIRPVVPGERLTLEAGKIKAAVHAVPEPIERESPTPADLRSAMTEAVDRVLLSERRVGLAVSGGLDSTILAGLLGRRGVQRLPTVSVCPKGTGDGLRDLGDLGLVDPAIATWRHRWTSFGPADLLAGLPVAVRTYGEPVAMTSVAMYRALATLARESGITVLLVGEGADELFAGYHRYLPLYRGAVTDPLDFYLPPERLKLVRELLGRALTETAVDAVRAALGRAARTVSQRYDAEPDAVAVVREFELDHSLSPLLRRTDHVLMAEGIEGRTPFLHAGVPELALRYSPPALVRGNRTKVALREAFGGLLPPHYRDQLKRPFRAPVHQWLGGPLLPRLDNMLAGATSLLHERLGVLPEGVLALRKRLAHGVPMAFAVAFGLLSTAEWLGWVDETLAGESGHAHDW